MSQKTNTNPVSFGRRLTKNLSRILKQTESDLPSLKYFLIEDLPKLKKRVVFLLNSLNEDDRLFTSLKVPIKKKYLEKLEKDHELHHNLFVFFLRYLLNLQKEETNKVKVYMIALEIEEYHNPLTIKYSFLPGVENIFDNYEDLESFEYLLYVVKIDGRWALEIIHLNDQKPFVIDFINPVLSHVNKQELKAVIAKVHFELYKKKLDENCVFIEKFSKEINDYSLYTCFMSYFLLNKEWTDLKESLDVFTEEDMKEFENNLLWLIYTIIINNSKSKNAKEVGSIASLKHIKNHNDKEHKELSSVTSIKPIPSHNSTQFLKKSSNEHSDNTSKYMFSHKMLTGLLKKMKTEIIDEISSKKSYSEVDKFINMEISNNQNLKLPRLKDFQFRFSKDDLKGILTKYGEHYQETVSSKINESNHKQIEFFQNYTNFNNLLWYYYNYDQNTYKTLIDEYNNRLHNHLLNSLGLPPIVNSPIPKQEEPPQELPKKETKEKGPYVPQYNVSVKADGRNNISVEKGDKNSLNSLKQHNHAINKSIIKKASFPLELEPLNVSKIEPNERNADKNTSFANSGHSILKQPTSIQTLNQNDLSHRKSKSFQPSDVPMKNPSHKDFAEIEGAYYLRPRKSHNDLNLASAASNKSLKHYIHHEKASSSSQKLKLEPKFPTINVKTPNGHSKKPALDAFNLIKNDFNTVNFGNYKNI